MEKLQFLSMRLFEYCVTQQYLQVLFVKMNYVWMTPVPFYAFVDRASLYNLVNKDNLVHNFS